MTAPNARSALLTGPFRLVLLQTFFAWGLELISRAVVPLVVLDRGGDAVLVGVVATAYALPSLLFRPIVGSLVDRGRQAFLLRAGILCTSAVTTLLLIPSTIVMIITRFLVGTGWAFFTVSNQSAMARIAPPSRRAQASGLFMGMNATAYLVMPGIAVAIYTTAGDAPAILFAVGFGLASFLVSTRLEVPEPGTGPVAPSTLGASGLIRRFIEPSALAGTIVLVTTYSAYSVFTIFPPVYAQSLGVSAQILIAYFPIFGLSQAISIPVGGFLAERLGRRASIAIGCLIAGAGMLIAVVPGFVSFTVAAVVYSISQGFVLPTVNAMVIERAPPNRLGSALATYSIGFQFATATSSLLWGALITTVGFGSLFVVATLFQVLTIVVSPRLLRTPGRVASPEAAF
jgi:MFS family permease